jgi:hypothetical protein
MKMKLLLKSLFEIELLYSAKAASVRACDMAFEKCYAAH